MFDATRLLGALTESRAAPSAQQRIDAAIRDGGSSPDSPLAGLLGAFGGQQGGGGGLAGMLAGLGGGQGGALGGLSDMAQRAFGGTAQEVRANNPIAVGGLGAIAGALLGGGRGAMGGGLLAVLGSLAASALASQGASPSARAMPRTEDEMQGNAMLALRAMIEAVKADGTVDASETARILERLDAADADQEARDWVRAQMAAPADLSDLAGMAMTPEQAAQAYGAALMAIEVDTPQERAFLGRLAQALRLSPQVVSSLHAALNIRA
ncbi:DUF533 domain-containing protein [Humitalea sp. 24SJ18S-53]|uniref:DUF533 domain-containing protein n=1 Tax=Humitalea sp. 24SJ18S-53 TaxID=3422307 RepID=UPI003D6792DD